MGVFRWSGPICCKGGDNTHYIGMDSLETVFLPTATPDLSAIETYWRDLKRAVLDVPYTNLRMLREAITWYTRYKKPNLVVENSPYRVI